MMKSDLAIVAEGIGKRYTIGARQKSYSTLRESLTDFSSGIVDAVRGGLKGVRSRRKENTFWALKDVSFEIKQGDIVGVVGSNGAGKSTLLKVLSRITDPTVGRVDIRGRIGSLLEVGTGFHPELSGRENIFLNGAILGMPRQQVRRQFDAIVDFAGVEKFIDTPVKRYSSGMYLRLAFAVAAHLEPEILLVDEVLAVGDSAFQEKCIGKMNSVAKEGRTVLFVSHNMAAIRSLCTRGILMSNGQVKHQGTVQTTIEEYFKQLGVIKSERVDADDEPNRRSVFGRVEVNGGASNSVSQADSIKFSTRFSVKQPMGGFRMFVLLTDMRSQQLMALCKTSSDLGIEKVGVGDYRISVDIPPLWLSPGMYSVCFKLYLEGESETANHLSDAFPLDVFGSSSPVDAIVHPESTWAVDLCDHATIPSDAMTIDRVR